jgi:hypothetical protein
MKLVDIGICVMVKKEQRYFKHWLEYHKAKGFGPIEVFYDDPEEKDDYKSADAVFPVTQTDVTRQYMQFNDYIFTKKEEDGWRLFIDIDEYADFTADDVRILIEEHPDELAFRFPQVIYIAEDDKYRWKYVNKPVTERFTKVSVTGQFQRGKVLAKLGAGVGLRSVHDPCLMSMYNGIYRPLASIGGLPQMSYRIRHYITKSEEEWQNNRCNRTNVSSKKYCAEDFARFNELRPAETRESTARLLKAGMPARSTPGTGTMPLLHEGN